MTDQIKDGSAPANPRELKPANAQPLLAFTGGGTGGHIYPGLAVIQALKHRDFSGRIVWIGSNKKLDREIVEREGVEYFGIPSGKLRRSLSPKNIADIFRVIAGIFAARRLLARIKPVLLFSKGGYVSVPPCRAAAALGIPYFTHESDASPGLATRLNAGRAERILLSWPQTLEGLSPALAAKAIVVGNPVRPSLFSGDAARGRRILGAPESLPVIFFVGGSQGSRQVNEIVAAILERLSKRAFLAHQVGKELFDPKTQVSRKGSYAALPYIGEDIRDILAAADIVVGRAGAGTVWESAALGKPMVLLPLAGVGTRGDQVENAKMAESAGAARCLVGDDASPENVLAAILAFLDDPAACEKARSAGLALSKPAGTNSAALSSADYIAELILSRISPVPGGNQ
jgi:UDP-N-acetylglucosamine--N-acetylmuramyl-(pentapeptide) pyrophosphoryl-undecaprenol N-acetylglucosamine transferase